MSKSSCEKAATFAFDVFRSVEGPGRLGFLSIEDPEGPEVFSMVVVESVDVREELVVLPLPSMISSVVVCIPERLLSMSFPAGLPTSPTLFPALVLSSEFLPESDIVSSKGRISSADVSSGSSLAISLIGE